MASSLASPEKDLKCAGCNEKICKENVVFTCSHGLCSVCLEKRWLRGVRKCPKKSCKKRSPSESPIINQALKMACRSFLQKKNGRDSTQSQDFLCPQHQEILQFFCTDDQKVVCVECLSQEHQMHSFCSIKKAVSDRKERIQARLEDLKTKQGKSEFHKVKDQIESQVQQIERQIKSEFQELKQFLEEEEMSRITALKEEENNKSWSVTKKIGELHKGKFLAAEISRLKKMVKGDGVTFLQKYKDDEKSAQNTLQNFTLDSGALIDAAKHLGNLRYNVWEKLKDICPHFPVILDPNSANKTLSLSEDLVKVTHGQLQDLPDNPERFSVQPFVLGSEGFDSGIHSWEVEVGNSTDWIVGVTKESVKRMETEISPENGIWAIGFSNNQYSFNNLNPHIRYHKIKVQLDFSADRVQFLNPDTNEQLHSFNIISSEKIYPVFQACNGSSLKILPVSSQKFD
ncbi:nuclear factor 7, ovary-like [Hoplias malabaricus]|uniref:nuclear factor 7, ovary-like n=1 Tax=Hoplias malabaricus TaxID=27720 RepID=UPI00346268BE